MTDREHRDGLAAVERYLRHLCPTLDLLASVRAMRADLDERLRSAETEIGLRAPEVYAVLFDHAD